MVDVLCVGESWGCSDGESVIIGEGRGGVGDSLPFRDIIACEEALDAGLRRISLSTSGSSLSSSRAGFAGSTDIGGVGSPGRTVSSEMGVDGVFWATGSSLDTVLVRFMDVLPRVTGGVTNLEEARFEAGTPQLSPDAERIFSRGVKCPFPSMVPRLPDCRYGWPNLR
jgi:hypothetical protein